jgi:small-conductance mechanosensitive channel
VRSPTLSMKSIVWQSLALLGVLVGRHFVPRLHLSGDLEIVLDHLIYTLLVVSIAWFLIRAIRVLWIWAEGHLPQEAEHEPRNRAIRTQLAILRRIADVLVTVVSVAIVLMQFAFVRSVGLSLLASAGLATVVVGLAAQRSLSGVIAGLQLSITQPVRIGDTVKIEKEVGTVEEINLTFVVVQTWDRRRLIVPISRFLEQPFENWTIGESATLGTVMLPVSYRTPIDQVRAALRRICEGDDAWDKKTCELVLTEIGETSMTLRASVSSASAAENFELRCRVRENLIIFLCQLDGGIYLTRAPAA